MTASRIAIVVLAVLAATVVGGLWYMLRVPGRFHAGPPAPLTAEEQALAGRLEAHVRVIASEPHNIRYYAALERSAVYIETALAQAGYDVGRQVFEVSGRAVRNIEAVIEPVGASGSARSAVETLVIGAHYDSYGDAPGANDNGTGVAAVIELARLLKPLQASRLRIRLVAFVNEEPPYFQTPDMGSWRYAERLKETGERVRGMLSLETLGAFSSEPGSQRYPLDFNFAYPTTADFVAFVAMPGSRAFLHEVIGSFRAHTKVPAVGGVGPEFIPGMGWSDHWSFARFGFAAVMVTDTALFRYPHYHRPSDGPDKVDYAMLARITKGIERVAREIAAKAR